MNWIRRLFDSKARIKAQLEKTQELARTIIPASYRSLAKANGIAPTDATSDEQILAVYVQICTEFRAVAEERGEIIPAESLHRIVLKFLIVFEEMGTEFYRSHLEYEKDLYRQNGLREDYKKPLTLF